LSADSTLLFVNIDKDRQIGDWRVVGMANNSSSLQDRVVRVFVSSTFRDMHAERDELIKRVFPQLRKLCEERSVTWSEVDLRWGITEEQSQRGEVLPICLAEIQRCRPYFIGLLGERYGWVPKAISTELMEQETWIEASGHRSVTELEILHGVLNNPEMTDHCFFYFRDPAYIDKQPPGDRADFLELPTPDEIDMFGQEEAERHAKDRRHKLATLKARIIDRRLPVRQDYPTPEALGALVFKDLSQVIERIYPINQVPDPLDREALDHLAFVESRAKVYISRQDYYDRLDDAASREGTVLSVLGESGTGKSALLSNWVLRYRQTRPDQLVLMHFIGATPQSADWAAMLRRIMAELKRWFGFQEQIPDKADALSGAFAEFLGAADERGGAVVVLDGLNQLEDRDGAAGLAWLPPEIPPRIRLIVSTLPGPSLDELSHRGWPSMRVERLDISERKILIRDYLAQFAKTLDAGRVDLIARAKQTANPLYLRALLDELRVFGIHEELDERINHYLAARTPDKLYQKILERYEQDYERDRPGLVKDAMSALWASRRGLSESEALELLGSGEEPLPGAFWSPLNLAAEQSLVTRSGLITFSHDFLRQAVRQKYLSRKSQRDEVHLSLAHYFETQPLGRRKIEELPWQLMEAREWQRVNHLLSDREFFTEAWRADSYDVSSYWARIEESSSLRMVEAYRSWLEEGLEAADTLAYVYALHSRAGHDQQAKAFYDNFAEHIAETIERIGMPVPGLQADALLNNGRIDEAMELYREQERICRENGNALTLQLMLGDQASILISRGAFDEAMRLSAEQEEICREIGEKPGLQRSLGHQAHILNARGEFGRALKAAKDQERVCRESNNQEDLQESLANQAAVYQSMGDLDQAIAVYKEQELICRRFGYNRSLAHCLVNQATVYRARGDVDEARRVESEQEDVGAVLGDKTVIASALSRRAGELYDRGQLDEAIELYERAEVMIREAGDQRGLAANLGSRANVLQALGEFGDALRLYKDSEQIYRDTTDSEGLQTNLGNQAVLLSAMDRPIESMSLCKEQENICRALGNKNSLQQSLGNQAVLLRASQQFDEAQQLLEEQERICRELGSQQGLAYSLINQALLLADNRGRAREALPLAETAYDVARNANLILVANQIRPYVDHVRGKIVETQHAPVYTSSPHPGADADRAARLNLKYQRELAQWKALPWFKRMRTSKPEPPSGI